MKVPFMLHLGSMNKDTVWQAKGRRGEHFRQRRCMCKRDQNREEIQKQPALGDNVKGGYLQDEMELRIYVGAEADVKPSFTGYKLRCNLHSLPQRQCGVRGHCDQECDMIRTAFQKSHPDSGGWGGRGGKKDQNRKD